MRLTVGRRWRNAIVVMGGGGARQVALAARINFCAITIDSKSESPKIFPSTPDDGEIIFVSAFHTNRVALCSLTFAIGNSSTRIPSGSSPRRRRMRSGPRMSRPQALLAKRAPVERLWVLVKKYSAGM